MTTFFYRLMLWSLIGSAMWLGIFLAVDAVAYGPKTQVGVDVARATWGEDFCPGGVAHLWTDERRPDVSPTAVAWVMRDEACTVHFYRPRAREIRDMSVEFWCEVIVHEWGHVAGREDEHGTGHLMDTRLPLGAFKPCFRATDRYYRVLDRARARKARAMKLKRGRFDSSR